MLIVIVTIKFKRAPLLQTIVDSYYIIIHTNGAKYLLHTYGNKIENVLTCVIIVFAHNFPGHGWWYWVAMKK